MDPFIFTEIAEFALSLSAQQKGQETFSGLAHLQPYRLIRAYQLADLGYTSIATRSAAYYFFLKFQASDMLIGIAKRLGPR
jgi:hypothetical protein